MQRRSFLKGAGIVTVAVVGGGVWRAGDQGVFIVGEGPAYEPWKDWRETESDSPLALVRAAILAASPHTLLKCQAAYVYDLPLAIRLNL